QPFYWQTDTAIARNSWCYTTTLDYKEPKEIIQNLIEVVAKNGNLLLNVGPKGDGSIPDKDRDILETIGNWLEINGKAIYHSKPWRKVGEGPTKLVSGQFQEAQATNYTSEDIRFTVRGDFLYALVMEPPKEGTLLIRSLKKSSDQNLPEFHGIIEEVHILGTENEKCHWQVDKEGLHVECQRINSKLPIVCQIKIK